MPRTFLNLPILYARTKDGRIRYYKLQVFHKVGVSEIHRIKAVNLDGKATNDISEIFEGVNIGKANETTRPQQAELVALSLHASLKDKGFKSLEEIGVPLTDEEGWEDIENLKALLTSSMSEHNTDAQGNPKPMLAKSYVESKQEFPAYCQPKLDGVRCLAVKRSDNAVELFSRNGKRYYHSGLEEELLKVMEVGSILDGELYTHQELTFQEIISAVKSMKTVSENIGKIVFNVYDFAVPDLTFEERSKKFEALSFEIHETGEYKYIQVVQTIKVREHKDIEELYDHYTKEGYEGVMVRDPQGVYDFGNRSSHLKKYKKFDEEEFVIIGVYEATGRDAGTAILEINVKGENGKWVTVKPQGDKKLRSKMYTERSRLIGKKVTVQFQGRTDAGALRFPSAKTIRDYE